jgi:hypothetical protein
MRKNDGGEHKMASFIPKVLAFLSNYDMKMLFENFLVRRNQKNGPIFKIHNLNA